VPNRILFNIGGDETDVDREFLERWYIEENPYDYQYDLLKHEVSRTSIRDLAELYSDLELSENGVSVSFELLRDPVDADIAENLMIEVRRLSEDLAWMLSEKKMAEFLEDLMKKSIR